MTADKYIIRLAPSELTVNTEYLGIVPRPTDIELGALMADIKENGMQYPILANSDNVIIDGHTRHQIASTLGLEHIPVKIKNYDNGLAEKLDVINLNLQRRQLNNAQKAELGLILLEIDKDEAKERQLSTLKQNQSDDSDDNANIGVTENKGESREIAASKVGIGHTTLEKAAKIKEMAKKNPEIKKEWAKALAGNGTISKIYNKVKMQEREDETGISVPEENSNSDVIKYARCVLPIVGEPDDGMVTVNTGCVDGNGDPSLAVINMDHVKKIIKDVI